MDAFNSDHRVGFVDFDASLLFGKTPNNLTHLKLDIDYQRRVQTYRIAKEIVLRNSIF